MNSSKLFYFFCLFLLVGNNIFCQKIGKSTSYIHPLIISDSAFNIAITSHSIVVVDFWAIWCKPCQFFIPEYEEVAKTLHKKVKFYKLDYDLCNATIEQYKVLTIPTIIIFKNGEEVKRYIGLTSKERIIVDLKAIIN